MLTSKQRAYLRGLANTIPALYQIGKGGISENLIQSIYDALEARELIKIHVLDNSMEDVRGLCTELSDAVQAEPVSVIGNKFVLYKESLNHKKIELKR